MRKAADRRMVLWALLIAWVFIARCLSGCSVEKDNGEKLRDLEFTVVGDGEVPEELMKTIDEKKSDVFKLTYSDGQNLYIVTGYGEHYPRRIVPDGKFHYAGYGAFRAGERGTGGDGKILPVYRDQDGVFGESGSVPVRDYCKRLF